MRPDRLRLGRQPRERPRRRYRRRGRCGGIGTAAIQGARINGAAQIIAVDPVEFKQKAALSFGATHSAATVADATDVVRDLTYGVMADSVVVARRSSRATMSIPT